MEFSITLDILLLNNTNLKQLITVNILFQFYQLQNNILAQDEVLLFSILSPAPPYWQELPQIIGIIPILKITTKFTVSPSYLIRVVS